jgi:2'-5' RNA ligase
VATAVIVRAHLPAALEALRRRSVADAADGVPAHLTMLYPFVEWDALGLEIGRAIATIAEVHAPIAFRMTGPHRWPDAIYVAVEPGDPFVRLQADLAATFPAFPIYGEPAGFVFVPHITVAEGSAVHDPRTIDDPAWADLPSASLASRLDVIATDGGPWELVWSLPLGRRGRAQPRRPLQRR